MIINKPLILAGPCIAESYELLDEVAGKLKHLSEKLDFDFVFKSSFDKANRTSIESYRGHGLDQTMKWLGDIKSKYNCKIVTDIHEVKHAERVAEVCDVIQIPAFLCRQTDLLIAAVKTGKFVNVKKGQFIAPGAMVHVVSKSKEIAKANGLESQIALTERGTCFGYGDMVVDMRSLAVMKEMGVPVIFDVTHSTQLPPAGEKGVSGASRKIAPLLARSAAATGCLDGLFLEVHNNPNVAKCDAAAQLNIEQAEELLKTVIPILKTSQELRKNDSLFDT